MNQWLTRNGKAVAQITDGHTNLKTVQGSEVWAEDALNATYPVCLVNHHEFKVSRAKKHANTDCMSARKLEGGRENQYLIY